MSSAKYQGKALITGASSGIGAVYADRLAKRGYDLVVVARDGKRLGDLAKKLMAETGSKVEVLVADLTSKKDLLKVEERLRDDSAITLLVNNAGNLVNGALVEADPDKLEAMIQLNVIALTRLSGAAVRSFMKRGSGALINIASVVALAPELLNATYGGTKAFVLTFTQALQNELKGKGLQVQAVLPGATRTEIWERGGLPISNLPAEIIMSTEDMVDAALVGFDRKERITIPALPESKDWEAFEAARTALLPNLSRSEPAKRYLK